MITLRGKVNLSKRITSFVLTRLGAHLYSKGQFDRIGQFDSENHGLTDW